MRLPFRFGYCAILFSGFCAIAHGAEKPTGQEEKNRGYFTTYFDNDLFGGNDRDYTNGLRFSWISGDVSIDNISFIQGLLRPLSGDPSSYSVFQKITGFEDPDKIRYNYGVSLTQLMFTPDDFSSPVQPVDERRYAGWLGLGFSLHVKDDEILNSVEFTIGTTGKNSFAEQAQDTIHDIRGKEKFNGWDDQIPNEITADISFVQKRRVVFFNRGSGSIRMDGLSEWGARLGSFRTEGHIGGFFRIGYNLPTDFSDPRLSGTAYSHRYFGAEHEPEGNWSFYTLFGCTGRVVGYDATLDGPLFHDFETGNKRTPLVGEVFAGLGIRYRDVEFSYVHTWRTEEYREQISPANFGSVAIRLRF